MWTQIKTIQQRLNTSEIKSTWYFSTISHSDFTKYYNLFYPQSKKIIPNDLKEYLSAQGLAYWFMDDGTRNNTYYSFSTASFSAADFPDVGMAIYQRRKLRHA